jgi:multidrug efflux pump subunit AcrA (membrane-fusion protein)
MNQSKSPNPVAAAAAPGARQTRNRLKPFRHKGRLMLIGGMTLLAVALLGITAAMSRVPDVATPSRPRLLTVQASVVVKSHSYTVSRKYTGNIVARRKTSLGFELAGKLSQVLVEEGQVVRAGTLLARLDTEQLEIRRQELAARKTEAEAVLQELVDGPRQELIDASRSAIDGLAAQVKLLELELARHQQLVRTSAVSVSDYDRVRFDLQSRQAEWQQARHQLKELLNGTRPQQIEAQAARVQQLSAAVAAVDVQLQKSLLRAPYDGTISRRLVDEGGVVSSGQSVLRLVEDTQLEAWVGIPGDLARSLNRDTKHVMDAGKGSFQVSLASRFPEIDPATQSRTVVFRLKPEDSRHLVDGQVVRVTIDESIAESGFWLPLTALQKDSRGLWTCFVLRPAADDAWQIEPRYLELLHSEEDRAFVRGTLSAGDEYVVAGGHRVVAGQRVRRALTGTWSPPAVAAR